MDLLDGMLQRDKDEFKRVCNKLISTCFICKSGENRGDYYFVQKYKEKFAAFLEVLGYRLEINEEYGVIQLTNPQNYNRLNLKLYESIILLILRILYDEKKRELSASDEVIVNLGDIQEKYLSLQIRQKLIDKTTMQNALKVFRRFDLVQLLDRDLGNEESRVLIHDSILMAVRVEDIKKAYEKLEIYRKGKRNDEEANENEADQLASL
ncbi:MAG: DUF4194 domain-containing protein [Eubacteriales bacterium]|nr:DUF4194 domain-containing protein [Eubacteriales bacterium]